MTFTVKAFKVIYYCTKASTIETTVNKECDNCMKQRFKTWENATFYHIILMEIYKSYKVVPKGLYVKKVDCIGVHQRIFVTTGSRKS